MGCMTEATPISPPPLPSAAPEELKAFVGGRADQVLLDPSDVSWIPKPVPFVPDALMPRVRAKNDAAPNSVQLSIGWSVFFRLRLQAAVVDGALQVRGGGPLHHLISQWVDHYNAFASTSSTSISSLEVVRGKVLLQARRDQPERPRPPQ